ncbi:MAG: SIR2 family protein [Rhodobacterales bacterium]|nr:SIR2 family protein [Rhodobacterales bacterium]
MTRTGLNTLIDGMADGTLVPYLGPGALFDVVDGATGEAMPADSDSLILAMNNGRPMAPKLMYEFPRAAMNQELKRGRTSVTRFLADLYGRPGWRGGALHGWLASVAPPYVIDVNRDLLLQSLYADRPHLLIRGLARLGGTDYRFRIHRWDGDAYHEMVPTAAVPDLPVLFKPLGSPVPDPTFVASDADFVDYITELMGGFAIPGFVKTRRKGRRYVFLGLRLTRDTERMVLSDLIHDAGQPAGHAVIAEPTEKEVRYCARMNIEIVRADMAEVAAALKGHAAPGDVHPGAAPEAAGT